MASFRFFPVFPGGAGPVDVYEQLFQAEKTRLTESDYHVYEKDYVGDPATDIENLLVDLNHRDQLIVIHHNAEGTVNPARHSDL